MESVAGTGTFDTQNGAIEPMGYSLAELEVPFGDVNHWLDCADWDLWAVVLEYGFGLRSQFSAEFTSCRF